MFFQGCKNTNIIIIKDDCLIEGDNLYTSGEDNRNLVDANCSQELTREDIESMQEQRLEGSKIIEKLVESSSSFSQKTKFSQVLFNFSYLLYYNNVRRESITC